MQQSLVAFARFFTGRGWVAPAIAIGIAGSLSIACSDPGKVSAEAAKEHVTKLVEVSAKDVEEVRTGLPEGAKLMVALWNTPATAPAAPVEPTTAGSGAPSGSAPPPSGVPSSAAGAPPSGAVAAVAAPSVAPPPTPSVAPAVASAAPSAAAVAPSAQVALSASTVAPSGDAASGLPPAVATASPTTPEASAVRAALLSTRAKVQDLRVAKSTFFALADVQGTVLRNDQDQDLMVGKGLFPSFPDLKEALTGSYIETTGSMPEAAGLANRPDGQWVAANPVTYGGQVRALYVTGWSWSAYAKRLQNAVRGDVLQSLAKGKNEPLIYVVLLAGKDVYGWETPEVNIQAVAQLDLPAKLTGPAPVAEVIDLTGRRWGVAAKAAPALGKGIAIAVLRSET
ncbi:MAG: hypothetical protein JW751_15200 [Polyangiaceae bacterium]|nr:hypothetical protein [Polyangiaceae bacterium]